ncbi:MAG TPA: hypothetical protein PK512_01295, partial [bacterium]|nr:hypothetical protein [bacterium]
MNGQIPVEERISKIVVDSTGGDIDILSNKGNEISYEIGDRLEIESEVKNETLIIRIKGKGGIGIP